MSSCIFTCLLCSVWLATTTDPWLDCSVQLLKVESTPETIADLKLKILWLAQIKPNQLWVLAQTTAKFTFMCWARKSYRFTSLSRCMVTALLCVGGWAFYHPFSCLYELSVQVFFWELDYFCASHDLERSTHVPLHSFQTLTVSVEILF